MMSYFRHPQTRNEKRKWYQLKWEKKSAVLKSGQELLEIQKI